jgi:hypothetical protein
MTIVARDLCGKCYSSHKTAGTLDAKYPAKEPAKGKRAQQKPVLMVVEETVGTDCPGQEIFNITVAELEEGPMRVLIYFEDNDIALGEYLKGWAKQDRRALSDQILFVLDQAVTDRINGSPA